MFTSLELARATAIVYREFQARFDGKTAGELTQVVVQGIMHNTTLYSVTEDNVIFTQAK